MSIFHITRVLEQYPELTSILGKKRLTRCDDAKVSRIDEKLLNERGDIDRQYFLVSHAGICLATVSAGFWQSLWHALSMQDRVLEAITKVGPEQIAYIVRYEPGFTANVMNGATSDEACVMTVNLLPKESSLAELIQKLNQDEIQMEG